jgi:NADH-quinone oxidoreductase subunit L
MLINRIGDFFLLVGIVILVLNFKSVDFLTIFSLVHVYSLKYLFIIYGYKISVIDAASFFILLGAITKSAQLGLHG